jgi:hypothetical protein
MISVTYLPKIELEDWPAFKRAIPGEAMLQSYDGACGWAYHVQHKIEAERRKGCKVIEIIVRPEEFVLYCRDKKLQPSLRILEQFARQKATRRC